MKLKANFFFSGVAVVLAIAVLLLNSAREQGFTGDVVESVEEMPGAERTYPAWMTNLVSADKEISPEKVFVFDCETINRKPESLTTTCADFGQAIFNIKWSDWSAAGAFGTGVYSVKDCNPSCAEGTRVEQPVSIHLKDLVTDGKKYYLKTAIITQLDLQAESFGTLEWDLGEFYREMWAYENS
jgi:hypothetical protein